MDTKPQFTRNQNIAAWTISGVALLVVIARGIWPAKVMLDQSMCWLLALAALPWFTLFFKKITIPGVGEAEARERSQGTTKMPLPPLVKEAQQPTQLPSLSPNMNKVLATLWRYQRQHFGDDITQRWTFTVRPNANEFPGFLSGLSEAVNRGWVAVSPETNQCMLTNEGLSFIKADPNRLNTNDVYRF